MTVEAPWGFRSTWQPAGPSTGSGHICPTPRDAGFLLSLPISPASASTLASGISSPVSYWPLTPDSGAASGGLKPRHFANIISVLKVGIRGRLFGFGMKVTGARQHCLITSGAPYVTEVD